MNNPNLLDNEDVKTADKPAPYSDVTLRDLFAMAVMAGMKANHAYDQFAEETKAELAYAQADALLAVRQKKNPVPS